jgi:hypothetical protein
MAVPVVLYDEIASAVALPVCPAWGSGVLAGPGKARGLVAPPIDELHKTNTLDLVEQDSADGGDGADIVLDVGEGYIVIRVYQ